MTTWDDLPAAARAQADAHLLRGHFLPAVKALRDAGPPPGVGLAEAQELLHARRAALVPPPGADDDALDVRSLTVRASALPGRILAVEAVWADHETHGWHVELRAVLDAPPGTARLATVHNRPGLPYECARARQAGRTLAARLGVAFSFPHPSGPAGV
ncbi:hypothetical protein ACGFZK_27985 [Streptomyces sp. NPDC048257]|uniref:hypothetical protein n=1 Tax=Streptomyces sp. NPDC048257 TaxID=3365526 RepID=UPI0037201DEB